MSQDEQETGNDRVTGERRVNPTNLHAVPFGTYGQLDYDQETDALLCHVCGAWKKNLASHAFLSHKLSAYDYRERAGLSRTTRLVTPTMRANLSAKMTPHIERLRAQGKLRRWDEDPDKWKADKAAAVAVIREGLRPETLRHRAEAMTEEKREQQRQRRRQRNLDGLDRATGEAISAGLHRAARPGVCERCGQVYQRVVPAQRYCGTCGPLVAKETGRDAARRTRQRQRDGDAAAPKRRDPISEKTGRQATCPRCGAPFLAASHRDLYCPPCRPAMLRAYQRQYQARKRAKARALTETSD